jgi:hypothetical protein
MMRYGVGRPALGRLASWLAVMQACWHKPQRVARTVSGRTTFAVFAAKMCGRERTFAKRKATHDFLRAIELGVSNVHGPLPHRSRFAGG